MQIVIELSEKDLDNINHNDYIEDTYYTMLDAIINGTPLPKGHGNLIQREDAEAIFKNARKALYEQSRKERIKDLQTREMMLLNAEQFIHLIHPIIEADKAESEET